MKKKTTSIKKKTKLRSGIDADKSSWKSIKKFFNHTYVLLTIIGLFISLILSIGPIKDLFFTESEKFEKEKIIKGRLHSQTISDAAIPSLQIHPSTSSRAPIERFDFSGGEFRTDSDYITNELIKESRTKLNLNYILSLLMNKPTNRFDTSGLLMDSIKTAHKLHSGGIVPEINGIQIQNIEQIHVFNIKYETLNEKEPCPPCDFYYKQTILTKFQLVNGCNPFMMSGKNEYDAAHGNFPINLKLIDNKLFISATFRDIKKREIVGIIEYNEWKLYKDNVLEFKNDDSKLEVRDKQGYIICAIKFELPDEIIVRGYFIDDPHLLVLSNSINGYQLNDNDKRGYTHAINSIESVW